MTIVDDILAHHGIKGMRWGVRRQSSPGPAGGAPPKAAKKLAKQDKRWARQTGSTQTYVKIYNDGANRVNKNIDKFNEPYKNSDFRKDSPERQAYFAAYSKFATDHFNAAAQAHGTNPSGTKMVKFHYDVATMDIPRAEIVDVKHDDTTPAIKLVFDNMGLITGVKIEATAMAQGVDFTTEFLSHHGIKGMRWGVRRDNPSGPVGVTVTTKVNRKGQTKIRTSGGSHHAPHDDAINTVKLRTKAKASSTHSLSNEELRVAVARMQLEQQYAKLASQPTNVKRGHAIVKEILGVGKTANEAYTLANSPVAEELGKLLKK
jgi:hypothetical protein